MPEQVIEDETCGVFRDRIVGDQLRPNTIHRFIVGRDRAVQVLDAAEARAQLGDPFATLLLAEGTFPNTAAEVLDALDAAAADRPEEEPLRRRRIFFVGDGTQVPADEGSVDRNVRFLATTAPGDEGPDVLLSAFHPDAEDIELMAWDRRAGGFNYYRTAAGSNGWIFAGNSRHALEPDTELKGPFESHTSGSLLMKELKVPWINWKSPAAPVAEGVIPPEVLGHAWFRGRRPDGADVCETSVARPSIQRWTAHRFQAMVGADGTAQRPRRVVRQVLESQTVNLITSATRHDRLDGDAVGLPPTFFADDDTLGEVLGLRRAPDLLVPAEAYARTLERFEVRWTDGKDFSRPGDTHFCFCVPERAFEDVDTVRAAVASGLLSPRLAASLLMVDFANPVFSEARARLLAYAPEEAVVRDGASDYSQAFVDNVEQAAGATPDGSPERELMRLWEAGDGWQAEFDRLLAAYYEGVQRTLATQEGLDAVFLVAEGARRRVRELPIFESELLFARAGAGAGAAARMRPDGGVDVEGGA